MKRLLSILLCLVILFSFSVVALAHEGDTHSSTIVGTTISPDLDLDQDGIPDYEDGIIDFDGDGIGDAGPTYQQPPKESIFKKKNDFPWGIVLGVGLFLGLLGATVILKLRSKKDKEE